MVDYLIKKNRFEKILFPNKIFYSSLYKDITDTYFAHLEDIKDRIRLYVKGEPYGAPFVLMS